VITEPGATVVLCYGDSNTYGAPANVDGPVRLPSDVRWTGQLQRLLGDAYSVIEEGLNGRTTDVEYIDRPGCNGLPYFVPCLLSHAPIDVVVIMLGTNDLKVQFDRSPESIAGALGRYVDAIEMDARNRGGAPPKLVLVSPVHIDDSRPAFAELNGDDFDAAAVEKSRHLGAEIGRLAQLRGASYADAADAAVVGDDGIHVSVDSQAKLADLIAETVRRAVSEDS